MKEICDCLDAMVKCDTVDILRVKARLSPEFEASASGGYRDVLVNLKFPPLEPPLDTYIVEVQLHLSSFLRLKKEEIGGHKTYRVARDLHIFDESVTKPLISEIEKRQLYGVSTGTWCSSAKRENLNDPSYHENANCITCITHLYSTRKSLEKQRSNVHSNITKTQLALSARTQVLYRFWILVFFVLRKLRFVRYEMH